MKRLLAILVIGATLAVSAQAQHRFGHHRHYGAGWGGWVAPLIIGGVVGAAVANNRAEAQAPPVIVQPTHVIVNLPPAPFGFHYEQMLDGRCNCYKWVLVAD
jgi:hypothetical protein